MGLDYQNLLYCYHKKTIRKNKEVMESRGEKRKTRYTGSMIAEEGGVYLI